jgi:hypothetical protein
MSRRVLLLLLMLVLIQLSCLSVSAQETGGKTLLLSVKRIFSTWDNPLQSEFTINGKMLNIFTSDTFEPIGPYLKDGWNTITVKTTPQEPANKENGLIFEIGPAQKAPGKDEWIMNPVLWKFRNETDWKLTNGKYSHPLGPDVKEVTLSYRIYYAGLQNENTKLKAGDLVLTGKPSFSTWNSPVIATVFVNGTPLNTFLLAERTVVITPFLKPGKNEIKLVSSRVKNSIKNNDIEFNIAGPAEWDVGKGQFLLKPILQFKSMQGWTLDSKTGMLVNSAKPDAESIERVIPFVLKDAPKP